MARQGASIFVGALLLFVLASMMAHSQTLFERLTTLGPLIAGHADLEKTCNRCHVPFSRELQTGLCLACHKPIATDRQYMRGFHGRDSEASKAACNLCHTDHKGRAVDIVQLNHETFNHAFTNFALTGSHKRTGCDGCHTKGNKYREAPGRCFDCHRTNDPHKGELGDKCDGCHNDEAWRRVKPFDHNKTRFPLVGTHNEVACAKCHVGERYKDLARTCISCHQLQDKHVGLFGTKCETCHTPKKWATISFDHDKATKFPLRGRHAKLQCEQCSCASCHSPNGWKRWVFDHDKQTRYPLVGAHRTVGCHACHKVTNAKKVVAPTSCNACHDRDDVHQGTFGRECEKCHDTTTFKQATRGR